MSFECLYISIQERAMNHPLHLNPFIFFLIKNGQIILWDYKNHQQFEIETRYFNRLVELSNNHKLSMNEIDEELLKEKILMHEKNDISWEWDIVSKIFHVGTKDIPFLFNLEDREKHTEEYITYCEDTLDSNKEFRKQKNGQLYQLPPYDLSIFENKNLLTILKNRMTCRSFYNEPITIQELSTLLYVTFGEIHGKWEQLDTAGLKQLGVRKSSPSGGALHPSEAYIFALNIKGLPQGIYYYSSHQHLLTLVSSDCHQKDLGRLLCGQHFAEELSVGIFITSHLDKLWEKYKHSRAYRVALLDIGHLSQTFQLCATAMGFDPWLTAAFLDTEINQILKIHESNEQAMFFVGAGHGDKQFLDKTTLKFLSENKI